MTGNGRIGKNYAQKHTTMINIGRKIISAFVEMDETKEPAPQENRAQPDVHAQPQDHPDDRFAGHFDKLLSEANTPGPDYYEFARMIAAMQTIPDESARYNAAFAGLQAQGLNKQRLLD